MNPDRGDTDVDPAVQREISVTFDRDMSKGMSWTGRPPLFPEINGDLPIRWLDQRTCVLPVKLKKGTYYRVGINATGFQNFKSVAGVPTPPAVIAFVTKGASDEVKQRVKPPQIVSLSPEDGAKDVDPAIQSLRVTFNMPMGEGMSWTGGGASMPKSPSDKGPSWSNDGKTCTLPVVLEPGRDYRLGLNDLGHNNFQSAGAFRWSRSSTASTPATRRNESPPAEKVCPACSLKSVACRLPTAASARRTCRSPNGPAARSIRARLRPAQRLLG